MIKRGQRYPKLHSLGVDYVKMTPTAEEEKKHDYDTVTPCIYTVTDHGKTIRGAEAYGTWEEAWQDAEARQDSDTAGHYGVMMWICDHLDATTDCYTMATPICNDTVLPFPGGAV